MLDSYQLKRSQSLTIFKKSNDYDSDDSDDSNDSDDDDDNDDNE